MEWFVILCRAAWSIYDSKKICKLHLKPITKGERLNVGSISSVKGTQHWVLIAKSVLWKLEDSSASTIYQHPAISLIIGLSICYLKTKVSENLNMIFRFCCFSTHEDTCFNTSYLLLVHSVFIIISHVCICNFWLLLHDHIQRLTFIIIII